MLAAAATLLVLATADAVAVKVRVTGLFAPTRETSFRDLMKDVPGVLVQSLDFDHAEAVLRIDRKKWGGKLDEVPARLHDAIQPTSHATFGIQKPSASPRDKLTRVEIPVAGLDCPACCLAAYEIVAKLDGVEQATASFKDRKVTALIDPTKASRAKLEDALRKRGVAVP